MEKSLHSQHQKQLQLLLRKIRIESGLSQKILAQILCRPQSFISKYESGERRLDLIELKQVCSALGISLKTFVNRFEKLINEVN
jgi:transcriptional regulator with XRE-family HTH domain